MTRIVAIRFGFVFIDCIRPLILFIWTSTIFLVWMADATGISSYGAFGSLWTAADRSIGG